MDKKFYEIPEIEVINLMIKNQILAGSDVDDDGGAASDLGPVTDPYIDPNA